MSENVRNIIINSLVSAMIGAIVGLVEIALPFIDSQSMVIVLRDAFVGLMIGTVIKNLFVLTCDKLRIEVIFLLAATLLAVISMIPQVFVHFLYDVPLVSRELVIILALAEALGMTWTYISYRTHIKLNDQLDLKKKEFGV